MLNDVQYGAAIQTDPVLAGEYDLRDINNSCGQPVGVDRF
jgi:hypothetical protein